MSNADTNAAEQISQSYQEASAQANADAKLIEAVRLLHYAGVISDDDVERICAKITTY